MSIQGMLANEINLPIKMILEELEKEELMFVYFHSIYNQNELTQSEMKDLEEYEYFIANKKSFPKINKAKKETLLKELLKYVSDIDKFDVKNLLFNIKIDKHKSFYLAFESFLKAEISSIINDEVDLDTISNIMATFAKLDRPCINICKIFLFTEVIALSIGSGENLDLPIPIEGLANAIGVSAGIAILNCYLEITKKYETQLKNSNNKLTKTVTRYEENIINKSNIIKELKEEIKELIAKNKSFENSKNQNEILSIFNNKFKEQEELLNKINIEMNNYKNNVFKTAYEGQVERLTNQAADLKVSIREKNNEIKELKNNKEINKIDEDSIIEFFKSNGISNNILKFIQEKTDKKIPEKIDTEIKKEVKKNNFGYLEMKDDKFYINYFDGRVSEFINVPEIMYLAQNQIILANEDNSFKFAFTGVYEDNGYSVNDLIIGDIVSTNPLTVRSQGEFYKVATNNNYAFKYKEKQTVGIDKNNIIIRAFRSSRINADDLLQCVKMKKHTAYFILNKISNMLHVRNIETKEENVLNLDYNGHTVKDKDVIFVKEDKIIHSFTGGRFYTNSTFYKDYIDFGVVKIKDGEVYCKKQKTGETVKVQNLPHFEITDGAVISVDEFNSYLFLNSPDTVFIDRKVNTKRETRKEIVNTAKVRTSLNNSLEKVVIIGDVGLQNNYKLKFLNNDFEAVVLDGYTNSYSKVLQACKDSNKYIVVDNSCCSHSNMWSLKEEVKSGSLKDKVLLFPKANGADRILDEIIEHKLLNS